MVQPPGPWRCRPAPARRHRLDPSGEVETAAEAGPDRKDRRGDEEQEEHPHARGRHVAAQNRRRASSRPPGRQPGRARRRNVRQRQRPGTAAEAGIAQCRVEEEVEQVDAQRHGDAEYRQDLAPASSRNEAHEQQAQQRDDDDDEDRIEKVDGGEDQWDQRVVIGDRQDE